MARATVVPEDDAAPEIITAAYRSMEARGGYTLRSEDIRYGESVTGRRLKVVRR